ncbi:hypothetical protein ACA910_020659 [Epithemia clementina (nom. ined.)]
MDNDAANALAQAMTALAQAMQAQQAAQAQAQAAPAAPAAAAPTQVSPYEGGALDLTSRTGTSLFQAGAEDLDAPFTGKVVDLHIFLNDLKTRAQTCHWIGGAHDILTIQVNGVGLNLLKQYGQIGTNDVETARAARAGAGADLRAKQNAKRMYQCLMK